ncbi:MAG: AAA family ATPase [Desulfocapsa sp.]|nr:AAA family ATPase [Desulfocapsa sp.]
MVALPKRTELKIDELRWRLDLSTLPFDTTDDIEPLEEIIGQDRGIEAFRFGMDIDKPGYNVLVTGQPRSGRLDVVKKLLNQIAKKNKPPCEFCYVNNFKNPEAPLLLRFAAGIGSRFKEDVHAFIKTLKTEIPLLFESQDYIARKKALMEAYEKRRLAFFKALNKRVEEQGFTLVSMQSDPMQRPKLMPIVDKEPMPIHNLEEMVKKGRFPEAEYKDIKKKFKKLKKDIDQMFFEINDLQKEVREKGIETDKHTFTTTASEYMAPLLNNYTQKEAKKYLAAMLKNLADNLGIFFTKSQANQQEQMISMMQQPGDPFMAYQVNLLVDNSEQKKQPIIIESYPTYRNLFGSIERVVDNRGVWRTDFTKIKVGSFLKANGGYLVLNLHDLLTEPGVWSALKRALKTKMMEIQTFDPAYWFSSSGIKPEAIETDIKVILLADPHLYQLLLHYDEDVPEIFKVRADFDQSMNKTDDSITKFTAFIRSITKDEQLRDFDKSGVAALVEQSVRMTGRKEKISTSFPRITDLIREADYWAGQKNAKVIGEEHVDKAIQAHIHRSNLIEEKIQEMIDRGSMMIDTTGSVVGQVNGLSVYMLGDYMFGRPSRITATTSMGKAGVINIEREAKLAGPIHNKGVFILSGYLRQKFAQDKPLTLSASLAFEQSYSGVEGDSASSTEIYALLSSLSEVPIKQNIAITGSVNQNGEIQAIGGANAKIEGFYDCCKSSGLTGEQGVLIPATNVADLMLRKDVVDSVKKGEFHVYAVKTIDEGIEILTGMTAGKCSKNGNYPKKSIHFLVDKKLKELAEGMFKFGEDKENS